MPIPVICPGCLKRFNVSDKFAGKQGPCPGCKTIITIPEKKDEVVVHAPEEFGPKGASGQAVLKPIEREEVKFSKVSVITTIALTILIPLVAFAVRQSGLLEASPMRQIILGLGALLIAPPVVLLSYTFLRDEELEGYRGQPLVIRVAICSVIYAALWGVYFYVVRMLGFEAAPELPHLAFLIPLLAIPGTITAIATLDLEAMLATVHYGLYLGVSVLLRMIMGLHLF
jgi:hypothetical protein